MRRNRLWLKLGLLVYGTVIFWLLHLSIHAGSPVGAALAVLLASPLPVFLVGWQWVDRGRWVVKGRSQLHRFDPHKQSWAFLADIFALAPMAACLAKASQHLPHDSLFTGVRWPIWVVAAGSLAIVGAWNFRKGEAGIFDVLRYFNPEKLLHNGVAFVCLASSLILMLFFVTYAVYAWITSGWSPAVWWVLIALGFGLVWLTAAQLDGWRCNLQPGSRWWNWRLTPEGVHCQTDEYGRRLDQEIPGVPMAASLADSPRAWTALFHMLFHTRRWPELRAALRGQHSPAAMPKVDPTSWQAAESRGDPPGPPPPPDGPNEPG